MEPSDNHATWHHQLLIIEKNIWNEMFISIIDVLPIYFHERATHLLSQTLYLRIFSRNSMYFLFYMVEEVLEYVEKKIRYVE